MKPISVQDRTSVLNSSELRLRFGDRLRHLRQERGLTPAVLSERIGVSIERMEMLEAGCVDADLVLLHGVSQALGTSLSDLFRGL